ncbi:uncharacterized protein LOC123867334 [Maniola jurtina]|uniref:uncharacterized protein LOC123867334 n=1 Tax=Maniola jurtina TaxID=191418 RepID=UPI001E688FB6|nr:uncharacterized protein LOC123867334 [Maniola jurtina]
MPSSHISLISAILVSSVLCCLAGDITIHSEDDECVSFTSCSSCLNKNVCTWCVAKSLCTKQLCGNDNVIYPRQVPALLSGPDFCPRIAGFEVSTYESGKRQILTVKLAEIYLFMAFTPWKCNIQLNNKNFIVPAILVGESVYCESFEMRNDSEEPYIEGTVKVLWNYNKAFDGSLPFKVCRCDLEPNCVACNKKVEK